MERTQENKAQNKQSFILYLDQADIFEQLTDEEAGKLIKSILHYVHTGEELELDRLLKMAFTPIKQSLKRDLDKWRNTLKARSEAGKLGGRPRKAKKANGFLEKQTKAKKADSVNVSVSVNEKNKKINKKVFFPDDELNDLFLSFIEHRKKLKKPMTDNAIKLAGKKILSFSDNLQEQKAIIEQSIINGWIGLFELKDSKNKTRMEKNENEYDRVIREKGLFGASGDLQAIKCSV